MSGMVMQGLGIEPIILGPTSVNTIIAGEIRTTTLVAVIQTTILNAEIPETALTN